MMYSAVKSLHDKTFSFKAQHGPHKAMLSHQTLSLRFFRYGERILIDHNRFALLVQQLGLAHWSNFKRILCSIFLHEQSDIKEMEQLSPSTGRYLPGMGSGEGANYSMSAWNCSLKRYTEFP